MDSVLSGDPRGEWTRTNEGRSAPQPFRGHSTDSGSLVDDSVLLKEITVPYDFCAHGTYNKHLDLIKKTGLNKMSRKHIHMIKTMNAVSGYRKSCQVLVHINMKAAMDDGIKFYESDNGVVLTEGINGVIDPKYFTKFEQL